MDVRLAAFLTAEMTARVQAADASIARVLRRRTARLARLTSEGVSPFADYKQDRPLSGTQAANITDVLPGVQHVDFEHVPFWDSLNALQGTHAGMDPQTYADTREGWWESHVPVRGVHLDPQNLVVTQKTVNMPRVEQLRTHPETGGNRPLYLVQHGGKFYSINGHHRIVADVLDGDLDHSARVLNLDGGAQQRMHSMLAALHPDDRAAVEHDLRTFATEMPSYNPWHHHFDDCETCLDGMRLTPGQACPNCGRPYGVIGVRKHAHDSGDGETIYHCPFCGSGQVVGGSDGTTACDFCGNHFTVQVQPEFAAMPQTVDGTPYPMPGMPGAPTDTPGGADSEDDVDAAQEDAEQAGQAVTPVAPGQPPAGPPGVPQPPPKQPQLVSATGAVLGFDEALAHYALRHAGDARPLILRKVKAMHTEGN